LELDDRWGYFSQQRLSSPNALTWQAFTNPIGHFGRTKPKTRKLVLKAKVKVVYDILSRAIRALQK